MRDAVYRMANEALTCDLQALPTMGMLVAAVNAGARCSCYRTGRAAVDWKATRSNLIRGKRTRRRCSMATPRAALSGVWVAENARRASRT